MKAAYRSDQSRDGGAQSPLENENNTLECSTATRAQVSLERDSFKSSNLPP